MILFPENGRLGNQLFQYCGLQTFFPDHRLVLFGFEDLKSVCSNPAAIFIPKRFFSSVHLYKIFCKALFLLSRLRIFSQISEDLYSEKYNLIVRKGLFTTIYVPVNVFFQHSDVFSRFSNLPSLCPTLFETAILWLSSNGLDPVSDTLVFVHIRRGDYLTWPSVKSPAALGLKWYLTAVEELKQSFSNCSFVLMGDDVLYLEDIASLIPNCLVSYNLPQIDFALMILCRHGILSASSFAWWGAKYASNNYQSSSVYLAPKYWIGHRGKSWNPTCMKSSHLSYFL